ncbi:MAG: hypothetical protein ACO1TE_14655 [Prosthecobacter sp.]
MVTLKSKRKSPGGICGQNARAQEDFAQEVSRSASDDELIITGSFNGLMVRLAKIDYFDVWLTGKKIIKKAKKERVEATMRMSEVLTLTRLTAEDIEIFCSSLAFIRIVETGEDPLLSARDVLALLSVFERFVDQGIISQRR